MSNDTDYFVSELTKNISIIAWQVQPLATAGVKGQSVQIHVFLMPLPFDGSEQPLTGHRKVIEVPL